MLSPETVERRQSPRRRTLKAARIMMDKKSVISCTARNISQGGSLLELDSVLGVPPEFELDIQGEPRHQAEVVWKTFTQIGVRFH